MIHAWISRQLPDSVPKPRFQRPINWMRVITVTTVVLGGITGAFVAWPYVMPVLQNRNLWAGFCIILILLFTSGYMFNHIRGTPYVGGNGKGGISYFAGGFQNQYGLESQIVAGICKEPVHKIWRPSRSPSSCVPAFADWEVQMPCSLSRRFPSQSRYRGCRTRSRNRSP